MVPLFEMNVLVLPLFKTKASGRFAPPLCPPPFAPSPLVPATVLKVRVFSRYSSIIQQGKLTGWVAIMLAHSNRQFALYTNIWSRKENTIPENKTYEISKTAKFGGKMLYVSCMKNGKSSVVNMSLQSLYILYYARQLSTVFESKIAL